MERKRYYRSRTVIWLAVFIGLILTACSPVLAQDNDDDGGSATEEVITTDEAQSNIEFNGEITSIDGTVIVVNGLTVLTDGAEIEGTLAIGVTAHVEGILLSDGRVRASEIEIDRNDDDDDDGNPAPTATPIPLEITGEIAIVNVNSIVVGGLTVILDNVTVEFDLAVGTVVTVIGDLDDDNNFIAIAIILVTVPIGTPEVTPEVTPDMTQEVTPEVTPDTTPQVTPEVTPDMTPEVTQTPDVDDDDVIIVIEGPVTAINVNIITIYNFDIQININNPSLTVLQIGDVIRVEGILLGDDFDDDDDGDTNIIINIVSINITYINVNVFILDNQVWRDDSCQNPPPPWAPANGWRARCEGGGVGNGNGNGNGNGRGGGRGGRGSDSDDDDD